MGKILQLESEDLRDPGTLSDRRGISDKLSEGFSLEKDSRVLKGECELQSPKGFLNADSDSVALVCGPRQCVSDHLQGDGRGVGAGSN